MIEIVNKFICDKLNNLTFNQYKELLGENSIPNKGQDVLCKDKDKCHIQYKLMKEYTTKQINN